MAGSTWRRVLIVQPSVQPPGGGNGVAAWMIQALQRDHEVSVFTLDSFDAEPINRFYGTNIDGARIHVVKATPRFYRLLTKLAMPLALLKSSLLFRELHRLPDQWDLTITANNEADLHRPGIQYVHYPAYLRPRPQVDQRAYHLSHLRDVYYSACDRLAGVTRAGVMRNLSLVNSDWTGRLMEGCYDGARTITLYPPVAGDFPVIPWEARAPNFVCIGRIAPEKGLDRIIDILKAVRSHFPALRLSVIGTRGPEAYTHHILGRIEAEREWVTLHENISRAALVQVVANHRFGLHAMAEEHFGMGVAEMVRAGVVTWVRNGGGQVEIVGNDERLLYQSNAEAIAKICAALGDEAHALKLREHILAQRDRFSEEVFVDHFRSIVADWFAARDGGRNVVPGSSGNFDNSLRNSR